MNLGSGLRSGRGGGLCRGAVLLGPGPRSVCFSTPCNFIMICINSSRDVRMHRLVQKIEVACLQGSPFVSGSWVDRFRHVLIFIVLLVDRAYVEISRVRVSNGE